MAAILVPAVDGWCMPSVGRLHRGQPRAMANSGYAANANEVTKALFLSCPLHTCAPTLCTHISKGRINRAWCKADGRTEPGARQMMLDLHWLATPAVVAPLLGQPFKEDGSQLFDDGHIH